MIGTGFSEKPKLPEPFPSNRRYWECPKTGLIVPKRKEENLAWREKLQRQAENDPVLQQDLISASAKSVIFWLNAFAWTYHQFDYDPITGKETPTDETDWPFISWEVQDEALGALSDAFENGHDILFDKSRKMGASWLCLSFIHHLWLFRPNTEAREMSRVENLVDSSLSDSLFWKHDYLNSLLPDWMCPPGVLERGKNNRTALRIHNELNGSTIAGTATTKHAMRAGRCQILLLDEFAAVDNGSEIRTATTAVTPCRIVNSTTLGAGTEYSRWKNGGQIKVFPMMFWDDPDRGSGRFITQDKVTKEYNISSPWLEKLRLRSTEKEIASEILGKDLEAGDMFFSLTDLEKHIAMFVRPPAARYNIKLRGQIADEVMPDFIRRRDKSIYHIVRAKEGSLAVWCELIDGRPDQSKTYIFGIDTSKGQGASESVVSIKCKQTGEKIAQWCDRNTPPYEFARTVIALALWCGGSKPQSLPFLKWENNGPGWDLGRIIVKTFRYPHYYISDKVGIVGEKKTDKYGFHTGRESKVLLLRAYERALLQGKTINHDKRSLEQAKYYIHYEGGGVGPAELNDKKQAEMLLHGDRVMADALTTEDHEVSEPKQKKLTAPWRSFAWRQREWMRQQRKPKGWRQPYDFTTGG